MCVDSVVDVLCVIAEVSAIWSAVAVLLATSLSALFRAQERSDARWREAERRRRWLESIGDDVVIATGGAGGRGG